MIPSNKNQKSCNACKLAGGSLTFKLSALDSSSLMAFLLALACS
jgi:hypothetical protein